MKAYKIDFEFDMELDGSLELYTLQEDISAAVAAAVAWMQKNNSTRTIVGIVELGKAL